MARALTVAAIEKWKPDPERRVEVPDAIAPGLYLVVQPSGKKSWAVRYRAGGKPRKLTIGPWPAFDLAEARDQARKAVQSAQKGGDPADDKRHAKRASKDAQAADLDSFAGVARLFLRRYAKPKNRDWIEQARLLGLIPDPAHPENRDDPPPFIMAPQGPAATPARKPFQDVRNRDIRAIVEDIVDRGAPIGANRTLAALRKFFAWASARDDLGMTENPAIRVEKQPEVRRDRVLTHDEIRLFWLACETLREPFGACFQLLLRLGQRREEVAGLRRAELNADLTTWVLPADRAKNKREHEIPLPAAARSILQGVKSVAGQPGLIFTTTGSTPISGFSKAKIALDTAMIEIGRKEIAAAGGDPAEARLEPFTLHDLRRTMSTVMVDELDVGPHIVEAILNHVSGHRAGVAGVYNHAKYRVQKRHALETWAARLDAIVKGQEPGNVVALRATA